MSCVDGLLRRRSLISIGGGVKYAVTAASNPDFMAALYANGYALNPEYMTMEEAAALTTETLGNDITDCEHVDLRYFVNFNGSLSNSASHRLKRVTMPNVSDRDPLKVNWCFWPVEGVVLTIPRLFVNHLHHHQSHQDVEPYLIQHQKTYTFMYQMHLFHYIRHLHFGISIIFCQ